MAILRKVSTLIRNPRKAVKNKVARYIYWRSLIRDLREKKSKEYLEAEGVVELLKRGDDGEFAPNFNKLRLLYDAVRVDKPGVVLEFGSGHSTVAMAAGLHRNAAEGAYRAQRIWLTPSIQEFPSPYQRSVLGSFCRPISSAKPMAGTVLT